MHMKFTWKPSGKKHSRLILFVLGLSLTFFGIAIFLLFNFFLNQQQVEKETYQAATKQADQAILELDTYLTSVNNFTTEIANDLSSQKFPVEYLPSYLENATNKQRIESLLGVFVTFKPYAFDKKTRLHSVYRKKTTKNSWEWLDIAKIYDYTKPKINANDPNTDWFVQPLHSNKSVWLPPYYGMASHTWISTFSLPFYYDNERLAVKQRGVVASSIALTDLNAIIAKLRLGSTGYAILCDQNNTIIAHPVAKEIGKKFNLPQTINYKNSQMHVYSDPQSEEKYWTFVSNLKTNNWKLVTMLSQNDFAANPTTTMRHVSIVVTFFILGIIAALSILTISSRRNLINLWLCSITISICLFLGTLTIWISTIHILEPQSGTNIIDEAQLNRFLLTQNITTNPQNTIIPTGLTLNNISIDNKDTATISGLVWQSLPINIDSKYFGITFPEATGNGNMEKIAAYITDSNNKIIIWNFNTIVKQNFYPKLFPFDKQTFTLQISPKYPEYSIFITPDLHGYRNLIPKNLPGISDRINLKTWSLQKSFYSYNTNYQREKTSFSKQTNQHTLQFNITLKRNIFDALFNNLLPLLLAAIMLFAVLNIDIAATILPFCSAMLLFLAISHFGFRSSTLSETITYLDYFYLSMYLVVVFVAAATLLYAKANIKIMKYKNNLITKLSYWPLVTGVIYLLTVILLGQL